MGCGDSNDDPKPAVTKAKHEKKKQKQNVYFYDKDEHEKHHHTKFAVGDAKVMPKAVMISCKAKFKEGNGTVCMFGGNNTDSYQAGYLIFKEGNKLTFQIQMAANGSDGPIETEENEKYSNDDCHIVAIYDGKTAFLYVDGHKAAEGERKWVPAEGGIVTYLNGSHKEGDFKDQGGEDGGGVEWIKDLYITDPQPERNFFSEKIFEYNHHVDEVHCAVGDCGVMPDSIFMRATVFIDKDCSDDGACLFMLGGNTTDSYQAGYMINWNHNKFLFGVQMNANESDGALESEAKFPKDAEYEVLGIYKGGKASLYIEAEDGTVTEKHEDKKFVPATGGVLSILTGSHKNGEGEGKDTAEKGMMEVDDMFIATI